MMRLELIDISKQYPGVKANDDVSLSVAPSEIHAVLGENGAGKSTLMKIIYGVVQPDAGELRWNGKRARIANPAQARRLGIRMVFQHFSLFDTLTVAENVWLGLDHAPSLSAVCERVTQLGKDYGLSLDPLQPVHTLSVGERQRVEIVRALLGDPQLLILDEPTSVLTPHAVEQLFVTLRKLADSGCSILYISHKLDEIRALCQRCTVLRAGRVTGRPDPSRETNAGLSRLMIGAEPPKLQRHTRERGPAALEVRGLSRERNQQFGVSLKAVELTVHAFEIVGVAGVSGNGQKELLAALSGEEPGGPPESIRLFGASIAHTNPRTRRSLGLHFVPEERLGRATVPSMSLAANTLLTRSESVTRGGWLRKARLTQLARRVMDAFNVRAAGPAAAAQSLSGGNLQKFVVGREIDARPKVLIVSQPTWGVDVGASAQIRAALLQLRDEGCAVLVVSEEIEELFEISDALVVLAEGRASPRIAREEASVEQVGAFMSGLFSESGPSPKEAPLARAASTA